MNHHAPPALRPRTVSLVLAALVAFDLILSGWGFFFPEAWYRFFHGAPYVDPQGLLRRCAANWTAFMIVQAIALLRWKRAPWLLVLVAGCRLGDALTDVTCLIFCESVTVWGAIGFPLAGVGNLVVGGWLIRRFRRMTAAAPRVTK
ncbi:MAG TPA: hypothetical protein PKW95_07865 [bacterium]|nr:hypothetical protein [bacterium]